MNKHAYATCYYSHKERFDEVAIVIGKDGCVKKDVIPDLHTTELLCFSRLWSRK